jgi:Fe-S cluster assembly protein SufD|tara:strand:- start:7355 stop:8395 length:1041 start_codon:yes stop_codon:yes gene_type:complete
MMYHQMPIPPRSEHLWRYTPWHRIHPSTTDVVPSADGILFKTDSDVSLVEKSLGSKPSEEIARTFLRECEGSSFDLILDNVSEPIHLNARSSGHVSVGHLNIEVKGSAVLFIHVSGEPDWAGIHITGKIHANSQLYYGFINELDSNSKFLRCEDWEVHRDASIEHATLSVGGFRCKTDIRSTLHGTGSSIRQSITVNANGSRHDDEHVEIHHHHGHTFSDLVMNSACGGRSHFIGTGLLTIAEGADKSDASQVFRNLLLSEKARAEAIPELEVLADDVSAAHGAASAPVDSNQMHYLMSRGLNPEDAESMIVNGFLNDAFTNLTNKILIEEMRTRLTVHLECELKR